MPAGEEGDKVGEKVADKVGGAHKYQLYLQFFHVQLSFFAEPNELETGHVTRSASNLLQDRSLRRNVRTSSKPSVCILQASSPDLVHIADCEITYPAKHL